MTTQRDAFDERLTHLEGEVADVKVFLGESATIQARMLNLLEQLGQQIERNGRRIEDIARHLGVPPRNGTG